VTQNLELQHQLTRVFVLQSAWITLAALQLAALVLWANPSAARTRASLPAAVLTLISTLGLCLVSYAEHLRAVRPSSLLNIFLLLSILLDIAHARTLWLRAFGSINHVIAYVSAAAILVKASLVGLEALGKTRWFLARFQASPPESTSNIYNRSLFWWLNPLFRVGYRRVLDIDDLFALDKFLSAAYWQSRFLSAYTLGEYPSKHRHRRIPLTSVIFDKEYTATNETLA
jgi:ATP-binding cassette subfamily C (CFTR/MRP) protein 1